MDTAQCASCAASDKSLSFCSRCKVTKYRNVTCQTAHWITHKKSCKTLTRRLQPGANVNGEPKSTKAELEHGKRIRAILEGFKFRGLSFGEGMDEKAAHYKLYIDCLHMRQEDVYNFTGKPMPGTIYTGLASSVLALGAMLGIATTGNRLPSWWTDGAACECIRFSELNPEHSLEKRVSAKDLEAIWDDKEMPMKLRVMARDIYGGVPFADDKDMMAKMGKTSTVIKARQSTA
ncbi:hypothetical protein LTR95_005889 [Oleoguttula sp. CCFEE 5521]